MLSLLLILVVLYVGLLLVARRSDHIIFQPQPASYSDKEISAPYQVFHITSGASGPHTRTGAASITTLYLPNSGGRFTLLMSHGNAEDIGPKRELYEEYRRRGFAVFAYDYRGYGTSTGTPTEEGIYADEYAAWEYLVNTLRVPPSHIILHGISVGTGPAVELTATHDSSRTRPVERLRSLATFEQSYVKGAVSGLGSIRSRTRDAS